MKKRLIAWFLGLLLLALIPAFAGAEDKESTKIPAARIFTGRSMQARES